MLAIKTWENIIFDFRQPVSYLIPAIVIAFIILLPYRALRQRTMPLSIFLFIIYAQVLFQTAFLSREPGSRGGIDLKLFSTWGYTSIEHAFFIENILMLVPFGILMPIIFRKMKKLGWCVLAGGLCSCGIELS